MKEIAALNDEADEELFAAAEETPSPAGVMDEMSEEEPVTEADLETDEAEDTTASIDEGLVEDIDAFFSADESLEQKEADEEIVAAATTEIPEALDEVIEEAETVFEHEESIEDAIPVSEEIAVDEEVTVDEEDVSVGKADEMLTDEELLQEIEGQTVGEEVTTETEQLLPETEITETLVDALSDEKLDEELFKKLEGAISTDKVTGGIEDLIIDEEIFDESETVAEVPDTAPERKELYQKLSSALQSLDDEPIVLEPVEEVEAIVPESESEFDHQLFDKLIGALETPQEQASIADTRPIDKVLEEILSSPLVQTQQTEQTEPAGSYNPKNLAATEIKQIIRMDTDKVNHLMNQVSELNASRSTLKQLFADLNDLHQHYLEMDGFNKQELKPFKDLIFRLGDTSVSLNKLSNEIREGVLNVRMVPISLLFDRYHEFVNDLTSSIDKQVELEITGEDTELEKMVIDEISEPLNNIINNAVEHGIETVDERKGLGKKETGKIKLEAYHENNEIVIEVADDGQGIDPEKVKSKALELGLFTSDELLKISDSDLKLMILNPEFSTVIDKGSESANRGEGLHSAKTIIEKLKGTVDISSEAGKGTVVQVRIPLNLLVVKALQVKAGSEVMALPVNCIEEIMRVHNDVIIEEDGNKFIKIHDSTLPVFRLTEVFNIEPVETEAQDERVYIIIVQADQQSIGLIVDGTAGLEEIVIKPLGEFLRKESGFSGATVINDGNISLIPDIVELLRIAKERRIVQDESIL